MTNQSFNKFRIDPELAEWIKLKVQILSFNIWILNNANYEIAIIVIYCHCEDPPAGGDVAISFINKDCFSRCNIGIAMTEKDRSDNSYEFRNSD